MMQELPIIEKTYDLVKWYIPILGRLPRQHKFMLGDRIATQLYGLLEGLVQARYSRDRLEILQGLNGNLAVLRSQTRLLYDFGLISAKRYQYIGERLQTIGGELGGWIRTQEHETVR